MSDIVNKLRVGDFTAIGLLYETVASTVGYLKALGIHVRKAKVAVVLYELGSEINEFKDKERVDA